ncbi:Inositol 2-dehydrogenase/D-chiro-inositol 3-dehydrogenase [Actinomadura sp. RB99]|uniref:Gfo/Idh/MocA family oxidoreductase n=1 Tax=Actinomadura sp. RB99 TaxID=2691577 RepID=UPI0016899FE5|nr:Inositol 2-dehydrogenase/D-chiro-inositol 3-dehydrogenase [Actinomadura sp. RB99]
MTVRVGLIGARRTHDGTGPFIAAHLTRAEARIAAVATSSPRSALAAAAELAGQGVVCEPWPSAERLLAEAAIDAVAICSPLDTHLHYLRLALERGLHVLCEKPLFSWHGPEDLEEVQSLITAYAERELTVHVNAQWPYTLEDFRHLLGLEHLPEVRELRMELAPSRPGARMLPEALPHVLSLLTALCPAVTRVSQVTYECVGDALTIGFAASGTGASTYGPIDVTCALRPCPRQPRPAAYEINGMRAERVVDMAHGYQMFFRSHGRHRKLADPLGASVDDFLAKIAGKKSVGYQTIIRNESLGVRLMSCLPRELAGFDRNGKELERAQERA